MDLSEFHYQKMSENEYEALFVMKERGVAYRRKTTDPVQLKEK